MNPLEQLALAAEALRRALRQWRVPETWAPWGLLLILCGAALWVLWSFAHPALSWFMAPLLSRVLGPQALHYPVMFRNLPVLYGAATMLIAALAGPILLGAALRLFVDRFLGRSVNAGSALREALRRAPTLVLALLPFWLLLALVIAGLGGWMAGHAHSGIVRLAALAAAGAGAVLVQSFPCYAVLLVVHKGFGVADTWREWPRLWGRGAWAALAAGMILWVAAAPALLLHVQTARLVDRGTPEVVGLLVALLTVVAIAVWFMLAAGSTLIYLALMADPEDVS